MHNDTLVENLTNSILVARAINPGASEMVPVVGKGTEPSNHVALTNWIRARLEDYGDLPTHPLPSLIDDLEDQIKESYRW